MKPVLIFLSVLLFFSCNRHGFSNYNKDPMTGQTVPADMVLVNGNEKIPPFYIGVSEEPNINYITYLNWLQRVYLDYPEVHNDAKIKNNSPDPILRYNDPLLSYNMEHPAFAYYPITGVTWWQARQYLQWKTDRVNEAILIGLDILIMDPNQMNEESFNLEAYLYDQYAGQDGKERLKNPSGETRRVNWSDGILLPGFRLPTEAEWGLCTEIKGDAEYKGNYPYGRNYFVLRWANQFGKDQWDNYFADDDDLQSPDYAYFFKKGHLAQNQKGGLQGPVISSEQSGPSHLSGNVREWILDEYKKTPEDSWASMAVLFSMNGFVTQVAEMTGRIYDAYGQIDLKDSLGRLGFRVVGSNSDGTPLWMQGPQDPIGRGHYVWDTTKTWVSTKDKALTNQYDTFYKHYKDHITGSYYYVTSNKLPWNHNFRLFTGSFAVNMPYYIGLDTTVSLDSMEEMAYYWGRAQWDEQVAKGMTWFELNDKVFYTHESRDGYFVDQVEMKYVPPTPPPLQRSRLVRGGTWKEPDRSYREGVNPDSGRADIGFRAVMAVPVSAVKEKYKVKW